jgi:PAS domain S-box-containing protein
MLFRGIGKSAARRQRGKMMYSHKGDESLSDLSMSSDSSQRLPLLQAELAVLQARLRVLVDASPLGIFFDDAEDRCVFVNATFCGMMELTEAEALGDGWARTVHPEDLPGLLRERTRSVAGGASLFRAEYRYVCRSGRTGWVEEQTRPVHDPDGNLLGYVGTLAEISGRKEEEALRARHSEMLEERVRERTAELLAQTERLAEMNSALKVLLRQREEDREELEQAVLANVRRRIAPTLDRLEGLCPGSEARILSEQLRRGLQELTRPFCHRLSTVCQGLTPTEILVAELIREGLGTKEIAARLGVGSSTVDTHRNHIRRKLGLKGRKEGLRAYLLALESA